VVNWVRIQRSASWSCSTIGSPELSSQSATAKPAQIEARLSGPRSRVPVLEKTAHAVLTIST
jgi:hypothetical protein